MEPHNFIKVRLGREATAEERKMISDLSKVSKLPNEFINLIIDYSAIKNDGLLSVNYVEKISKTVVDKKIDTMDSLKG